MKLIDGCFSAGLSSKRTIEMRPLMEGTPPRMRWHPSLDLPLRKK